MEKLFWEHARWIAGECWTVIWRFLVIMMVGGVLLNAYARSQDRQQRPKEEASKEEEDQEEEDQEEED